MIETEIYAAKRLLVIGAHAFDAEVIAGPLAFVAATLGAEVTFLHLTMGEQGHRCLAPQLYAEQKRGEATKAASRLRATWRSLDLPDAFLPDDDNTAIAVCDVIRELRPDVIITHWAGSWHKDHRTTSTVTKNAIFYAALPTLTRMSPPHSPNLLLFGENWEDDEGFVPMHLVDVTEGFTPWREAAEKYELARGLSTFPYMDYYASLYRIRGCIRGSTYAQAFMTTSNSWNAGAGLFMPPLPGGVK